MKTLLVVVLALALCPIVVACGVSSPTPDSSLTGLPSRATFALWPYVSGRAGSYGAETPQDVANMAADGFSILLQYPVDESVLQANGVSYIDPYAWLLIYYYGCADYFSGRSDSCQISDATSTWIASQFQAHVAGQIGDRNIIAYWFLDDYPGGNISITLQKMHDILVASNSGQSSSFPRPAICGFGGQIAPLTDTIVSDADPYMTWFATAMTNFSPSYCDMIALYPYAVNEGTWPNDPSRYDWSLKYMLPAMLRDLQARGWNSSTEPLVGIPQAFGYSYYVAPTGADIAMEMTAFCKAGAVAVIAYSWDDDYHLKYPDTPYTEPVNSPDMRAGLIQGLAQCREYWPQPTA